MDVEYPKEGRHGIMNGFLCMLPSKGSRKMSSVSPLPKIAGVMIVQRFYLVKPFLITRTSVYDSMEAIISFSGVFIKSGHALGLVKLNHHV